MLALWNEHTALFRQDLTTKLSDHLLPLTTLFILERCTTEASLYSKHT